MEKGRTYSLLHRSNISAFAKCGLVGFLDMNREIEEGHDAALSQYKGGESPHHSEKPGSKQGYVKNCRNSKLPD